MTSPLLPAFPFSERLTIETVGEKGFPSAAADYNFFMLSSAVVLYYYASVSQEYCPDSV